MSESRSDCSILSSSQSSAISSSQASDLSSSQSSAISSSQASVLSSSQTSENPFEWKAGDDLTEIEKMKAVIYVKDRWMISNKAYHELSQIAFGLPRSYLVEDMQREISKSFDVQKTPGDSAGAQMSLIDELKTDKRVRSAENNIMLKISGDGTKLTRH
eukprot:TCONS_00036299-protein